MPMLTEVDRLEVQVLVDNVTDSLSSTPPFVTREWPALVRQGMRRVAGAACAAPTTACRWCSAPPPADASTCVLFDAGPVDYAVEHNGTRLGIDFGAIEAVVLSHGHWDHGGGLLKAFELMRDRGARTQRYRSSCTPACSPSVANASRMAACCPTALLPTPDELADAGADAGGHPRAAVPARWHVLPERRDTARDDIRDGLRNQVRRTAHGEWEPDPLIMDERFLAVAVKDKGIVVFTACSHAGVVNVLTHARECFPDQKLYAVMGGFHLSGETERCIPETVRDIASFGLSVIAPGHCTGWRALNSLVQTCGEETPWCRSLSARSSPSDPRRPLRESCRPAVRCRCDAGRAAHLGRVRKPDLRRGGGEPHDGHRRRAIW